MFNRDNTCVYNHNSKETTPFYRKYSLILSCVEKLKYIEPKFGCVEFNTPYI